MSAMPRFPPPGPRGPSSPASSVLSRHSDFLPSLSPRFVSFAWRYHGNTLISLPPAGRVAVVGPGVGHPVSPSGTASVETTGPPKFLGNPDSRLPMFSDPGRPVRLRPTTRRPLGPRFLNNEGADNASVSGLHSMAFGIAAYVSRDGCPPNRARLASRCWSGSPGRAFTRRAPLKGFQITSCELSSFPKLLGTIKS